MQDLYNENKKLLTETEENLNKRNDILWSIELEDSVWLMCQLSLIIYKLNAIQPESQQAFCRKWQIDSRILLWEGIHRLYYIVKRVYGTNKVLKSYHFPNCQLPCVLFPKIDLPETKSMSWRFSLTASFFTIFSHLTKTKYFSQPSQCYRRPFS